MATRPRENLGGDKDVNSNPLDKLCIYILYSLIPRLKIDLLV